MIEKHTTNPAISSKLLAQCVQNMCTPLPRNPQKKYTHNIVPRLCQSCVGFVIALCHVTNVRGIFCLTGSLKKQPVSKKASKQGLWFDEVPYRYIRTIDPFGNSEGKCFRDKQKMFPKQVTITASDTPSSRPSKARDVSEIQRTELHNTRAARRHDTRTAARCSHK